MRIVIPRAECSRACMCSPLSRDPYASPHMSPSARSRDDSDVDISASVGFEPDSPKADPNDPLVREALGLAIHVGRNDSGLGETDPFDGPGHQAEFGTLPCPQHPPFLSVAVLLVVWLQSCCLSWSLSAVFFSSRPPFRISAPHAQWVYAPFRWLANFRFLNSSK